MNKTKHKCPVCGKTEFPERDSFEICPECGWEDDSVQEDDPEFDVGSNEFSLNEYREKYNSGWRPSWIKDE